MWVVMTQQIGGTRGDQKWPPPGTRLEIADDEGRVLIGIGAAREAPPPEPVSQAPARKEPEKPKEEPKVAENPQAEWPPKEERAVAPAAAEVRGRGEVKPSGDEAALDEVAPRRGPGRPRKDGNPPRSRKS